MSLPFEGVSALVTGGSRGIGRAVVTALASRGAKTTFTGSNEAAARETISASGAPEETCGGTAAGFFGWLLSLPCSIARV